MVGDTKALAVVAAVSVFGVIDAAQVYQLLELAAGASRKINAAAR